MNRTVLYTLQLFLIINLCCFCFPALSANLAFLYDTPAQYFNEQDWKMLEANIDNALSNLPNNKSKTWKNPKTGNGGTLMPLNSVKKQGTVCRNLQITNYAQHRKDQSVFLFCKYGSDWKASPGRT